MDIVIDNICCGYGQTTVIKDFSATFTPGKVFCLLGQNGIGKTTLFKSILGFLPLQRGTILFGDQNVQSLPRREFAKILGYVPQAHQVTFAFSVLDVVLMGRIARLNFFAAPGKEDKLIAERCLHTLGISALRDRPYTELSGGERQMVLLARALTQEPKFLMMDEPTSNLDFGNQVLVMQNIARLAEEGYGIVMTTHFPDHVFLCKASAALLQKDYTYRICTESSELTEEDLLATYGVEVALVDLMHQGQKMKVCRPLLKV